MAFYRSSDVRRKLSKRKNKISSGIKILRNGLPYLFGFLVYFFLSRSVRLLESSTTLATSYNNAVPTPRDASIPSCYLDPPWGIPQQNYQPAKESASAAAAAAAAAAGVSRRATVCLGTNVSFPSTTATHLTCDYDDHGSSLHRPSSRRPQALSQRPILTVALLYYAEPAMLLYQLNHYQQIFNTTKPTSGEDHNDDATILLSSRTIRILIIDDGSPPGLRASDYVTQQHYEQLDAAALQIVQIRPNIPWNQPGARNLAMHVVQQLEQDDPAADGQEEESLVVLLDLDLLLPRSVLQDIVFTWPRFTRSSTHTSDSDSNIHNGSSTTRLFAHVFNRSRPDGITYKIHPSAVAMTPSTWWSQVGGMDEDFSGHYGSEDSAFWWKWEQQHQQHHKDNIIQQQQTWIHGESILEQFDLEDPCDAQWLQQTNSNPRRRRSECLQARQQLLVLSRSTNLNIVKWKRKRTQGCWSNSFLRFQWQFVPPMRLEPPP